MSIKKHLTNTENSTPEQLEAYEAIREIFTQGILPIMHFNNIDAISYEIRMIQIDNKPTNKSFSLVLDRRDLTEKEITQIKRETLDS